MFSLHTSTLTSHGPQLIEQMQELVSFVEASLEDARATHEVEQGLWRGVLALGHRLLGAFFAASGEGDVGEEHLTEPGRVLKRLAPRTRPDRTVDGKGVAMRASKTQGWVARSRWPCLAASTASPLLCAPRTRCSRRCLPRRPPR